MVCMFGFNQLRILSNCLLSSLLGNCSLPKMTEFHSLQYFTRTPRISSSLISTWWLLIFSIKSLLFSWIDNLWWYLYWWKYYALFSCKVSMCLQIFNYNCWYPLCDYFPHSFFYLELLKQSLLCWYGSSYV